MVLSDICTYNTRRISIDDICPEDYISTENMLPNKGGVTLSSSFPEQGWVINFQVGDILISNIRPYFKKIWFADRDGVCSADVLCIRAKENVNKLFLYYLLSQQSFFDYVMSGAKGCKMPRGDKKQIMQWPVNLPPMEEQKQIAAILSSLDDKIENNRKINENLEQQAEALFKSWFVDFEPFKNGKFIDSELGKIPEGWRVCKVADIADTISGYSYKGNDLQDSSIAMVTIKNFDRTGYFKIDGYKEIVPSAGLKDAHFVELMDLLVAHTDLTQNADIIGNPALVLSRAGYEKLIMSMDLSKVILRDKIISNSLMYCILKDRRFKSHALGYVNGTTVLHLSRKAIREYKIALPSESLLKEMSKKMDAIFLIIANNYKEVECLKKLRDTLLPKLMSGEIKL